MALATATARSLLTLLVGHRNVLNFLKVQKIDLAKLTEIMTIEEVKEKLNDIVDECQKAALELQTKTGFIVLERGYACASTALIN